MNQKHPKPNTLDRMTKELDINIEKAWQTILQKDEEKFKTRRNKN